MQVESDMNFDFIIDFLASFAHDLPSPADVKARYEDPYVHIYIYIRSFVSDSRSI